VLSKNSVLRLDLNGVILNGKRFLGNLKKYKDNAKIKAIVININSPGGLLGLLKKFTMKLKKFAMK